MQNVSELEDAPEVSDAVSECRFCGVTLCGTDADDCGACDNTPTAAYGHDLDAEGFSTCGCSDGMFYGVEEFSDADPGL